MMMKLLLDTHILLWWLHADPCIPAQARSLIESAQNTVFVSAATAWEIGIKKSLGKLRAPDDLPAMLQKHYFTELPISVQHALAVEHLPLIHGDPFDRLLIAQSQIEHMTLLTRDARLQGYEANVMVV